MPQLENVSLDGHTYSLRLVGPQELVWPNPPVNVQTFQVLNQPNMVARPLLLAAIPGSPDFVSGSWTGRIDDAGEMSLTFPSGLQQPSDGPPWQTRFDPGVNGLWNEWIEIYRDGELDFVGNVQVTPLSRGFVQVTGFDGSYALKNAYERDWTVVMAPRDVIERGTQVWVPTTTDNFPAVERHSGW